MEKSSRADRARQFMPFSALRGFEELINRVESAPTPRRELSEYEAELLGRKLLKLTRGSLVAVTYYNGEAYVRQEGMLSEIDYTLRFLRVVKKQIAFDDISDVSILSGS